MPTGHAETISSRQKWDTFLACGIEVSGERLSSAVSRAAFIQQCYQQYLGRLADAGGLEALHQTDYSLQKIEAAFREGSERKALLDAHRCIEEQTKRCTGRKVLLVGAYGNGNLGDAIQPSLIADSLRRYDDIDVFSYSDLNTGDYDFPNERKLGKFEGFSFGPLNGLILSLFDCLLIGGGGLLAYPHLPMWNEHWPYLLNTPYALWACGVAHPIPSPVVNLVKQASTVSGRDQQSLQALSALRSDALYCPDPALALLNLPLDAEGEGRAYILRGPVREIHHKIKEKLRQEDIVIAMEIGVDWPLFHLFPKLRVVSSIAELVESLAKKNEVISERYHGAVVAMHVGKVTYGLTCGDHNEMKIQSLFEAVGASNFCNRERILGQTNFPHTQVRKYLQLQRDLYESATNAMIGRMLQLPAAEISTYV